MCEISIIHSILSGGSYWQHHFIGEETGLVISSEPELARPGLSDSRPYLVLPPVTSLQKEISWFVLGIHETGISIKMP